MSDRKPSRPWRVHGARGLSTDHRSERAAYEAVKTITTGHGATRATVYHWENGSWKLYERVDANLVTEQEWALAYPPVLRETAEIRHRGDPRDNDPASLEVREQS